MQKEQGHRSPSSGLVGIAAGWRVQREKGRGGAARAAGEPEGGVPQERKALAPWLKEAACTSREVVVREWMISRGFGRERDPLVREVLFPLGQMVMTPGVRDGIPPSEMLRALRRHAGGDWGKLEPEDRQANDDALKNGGRLVSSYLAKNGTKFWIITESDRSATTVLLPEEY